GCRRELLDRTLIWNLPHLRKILAAFERHHNDHRPHMALSSAATQALRSPRRTSRQETTGRTVRWHSPATAEDGGPQRPPASPSHRPP
ncbi:MAG: integrase core domain-containing protein, partial [Streptosporangiaceae bacterium]